MMKKILMTVLFAFALVSLLAACFGGGGETPSESEEETTTVSLPESEDETEDYSVIKEYIFEVESLVEISVFEKDRKIYAYTDDPENQITFECASDAISVLSDGTIVVSKAGEALVRVRCGDKAKTCTVKVYDAGEIPVISAFGVTGKEMNLVAGDVFPLDITVKIGGVAVSSAVEFSVADESVATVDNDGLITAKSLGETDITVTTVYQGRKGELVIHLTTCSDTVVRLSTNRASLTRGGTEKAEFIGVYTDGQKVNGASVVWASADESVATVQNGTITAVGLGKTRISAEYTENGKKYISYVLVEVDNLKLALPSDLRIENGSLVWREVDGAKGYKVYDGMNRKEIASSGIALSELNPSDDYFGERNFTVYALSGTDGVEDGEAATLSVTFDSLAFNKNKIIKTDTHEAKISVSDNKDFVSDSVIYRADPTSTSLPGKPDVYGLCFKKVYNTEKAYTIYGSTNGTAGNWLTYSLITASSPAAFYNANLTFWAFSEKPVTFRYLKMDESWNREILQTQTVEAYKWQKIVFTITNNDFPFMTMISATNTFYFTDMRISKVTYSSADYSDIYKGYERVSRLITAINELSAVDTTLAYGENLRQIRKEYDELSAVRKADVTNYAKFANAEKDYGEIVYGEVKENTAYKNAETLISRYNSSYDGATLKNADALEKKAADITSTTESLDAREYYALVVKSAIYTRYLLLRNDYLIIEDTLGTPSDRITASSYYQEAGTGFTQVDGVDTVKSGLQYVLNHPSYGYLLTMGTNPRKDTAINFKRKSELDLSGYTHVIFAVKNPREEKLGVYLYDATGRVKTLAEGIEKGDDYGEYTTIIMTVEEFLNYDIDFGYSARPAASANIWLTKFIAIKADENYSAAIARVNGIISGLSAGVTLSSGGAISEARTLYNNLPEGQRVFVTDYAALVKAEKTYGILNASSLISSIGTVTASEECLNKIVAARTAYDALDDGAKAEVSNYSTLVAAEQRLSEIVTPDEAAIAVQTDIENFLSGFTGVSLENLKGVLSDIDELDGKINSLTALERYSLENLSSYRAAKSSFKVIDDMTGTDIASRFKLSSGANGINNGDTAPGVASALNDEIYGKCATIGKNGNGLDIKYAATDGLDLSGYTHVLMGVKNRLGATVDIKNCVTGETLKTDVKNDTFAVVVLTVKEFMTQGIALWVGNSGSVWLTSIVAVTIPEEYFDLAEEIGNAATELNGAITPSAATALEEVEAKYDLIPDGYKYLVDGYSAIENAKAVMPTVLLIDGIGEVAATEECMNKILGARNSYDALSETRKTLVGNFATLTDAESALGAYLSADETVTALQQNIDGFTQAFTGVTPANLKAVLKDIKDIDDAVASLTAIQRYALALGDYEEVKASFKVVDDMTGTDIASRFKLSSGANGINNGDTAPGVASALNDATYGKCATIGKNGNGLDIKYAATDGLDLSGYTHVYIGVKNNLGTTVDIKNCSTGATLASGVQNGTFAVVKLTVREFMTQGIAIWVGNSGSVWLTSIVAVKE